MIGDRSYKLGINYEKQYRNIKSPNTRHTLCKTSYWEIISWGFCQISLCLYLLWGYNPFGHYAFGSQVWRKLSIWGGWFCGSFWFIGLTTSEYCLFHTIGFRARATKVKNFKQSSQNNSLNFVFHYSSDRFICFSLQLNEV